MRKNVQARRVGIALLLLVALSFSAFAEGPPPEDKWTFGVQPYLWVPSLNGNLNTRVPAGGVDMDINSNQILEAINFAFMVEAEARKGRWALLTDFIYLDMGAQDSKVKSVNFTTPGGQVPVPVTVGGSASVKLQGVLWELAGSYTVARSESSSLDVLLGFRYFGLDTTTDWQLAGNVSGPAGTVPFVGVGSAKQSEDLLDGIVGVRGRVGLGSGKWGIPYYLDVGAGSSTITCQAAVGIQYRFSWIDLNLMYRYLYYDEESGKLLQNVSLGGPAFGVNFRF